MSSTLREEISKWRIYNVSFSKAALCISGLVFSHAFVEYTILSVLMYYIDWEDYNLPKAAAIVNAQQGISILIAVVVAYFADNWISRFNAIVGTMAAFIAGLGLLRRFPNSRSRMFYLAVFLLTLGKSGRSPTVCAFIKDQFDQEQSSEMAKARGMFWWVTAWFLGATVATIVSSLVSRYQIIITSTIITAGVAYLLFWSGTLLYKRIPPTYDINYKMIHWRRLLPLVPLWITFLIYSLVEAAGTTFFLEQSDHLQNYFNGVKIPVNFFFVVKSLATFIISHMSDILISKLWREETQQRRATAVRIGIGIFVSFLCCLTAMIVEFRRLKLIPKNDYQGQEFKISMHVLWLTPQYFLLGCTTGLVENGMEQFFYDHVPESMKLYELPFNECVLGIGKFVTVIFIVFICKDWFGYISDASHLDRYYLMLAMLSLGGLLFFTLALYLGDWKIDPDPEDYILEQGLVLLDQTTSSSASLMDRSAPTGNLIGLHSFKGGSGAFRGGNGARPKLSKSHTK